MQSVSWAPSPLLTRFGKEPLLFALEKAITSRALQFISHSVLLENIRNKPFVSRTSRVSVDIFVIPYIAGISIAGHTVSKEERDDIAKISSFDLERYKKYRQEEGAKPGTINRELSALSHLYTKAVEWNWITHKPFAIKKFKEDRGRIVYLTPEQIERLLEAAKQDQNEHIYPFIVIGLETSMRKMELLSIRLEHITPRRVIYIPEAKGGAREQPITKRLAEFLATYIESAEPGQEWLFSSPGSRTGHTVSIEKPFRRVVKVAGLDEKKVVRHTLRHTAITHLVQAGVTCLRYKEYQVTSHLIWS